MNGYICAEPSLYGDPLQVALFTPDLDYHPVAVYCYSGDTLVCIAYSHPQNEYNSYEEASDGTELAYYEDENGSYRADIIASPTIQGGRTTSGCSLPCTTPRALNSPAWSWWTWRRVRCSSRTSSAPTTTRRTRSSAPSWKPISTARPLWSPAPLPRRWNPACKRMPAAKTKNRAGF